MLCIAFRERERERERDKEEKERERETDRERRRRRRKKNQSFLEHVSLTIYYILHVKLRYLLWNNVV